MSKISSVERFKAKYRTSWEMYTRSLRVSRGMNHDSRACNPHPIVASHAKGSKKWDVDGNEHIDYSMGHGALLFGHAHPAIVKAVSNQIGRGTLYAHEHEGTIKLAELVNQLVPAAEQVEFVTSGNEANILIAQIARAYTGRSKMLKFEGHDFGWSDEMNTGSAEPFDKPMAGRIPPAIYGATSAGMMIIPASDEAALEEALAQGDIAALFIEGAGEHGLGIAPKIVETARHLTEKYGTLLVFDEVITGFRWSPGGWQSVIGITPDLCSLAKVLGGGLPIGAICGRSDIMDMLKSKPDDPNWNRFRKVPHGGSYNGNAASVAAGIAVLDMASTGEPQNRADQMADRLCIGMNSQYAERRINGRAFRNSSVVHLMKAPEIAEPLLRHMFLNGVHIHRGAITWVSAVHTKEDIDQTISAFGLALDNMTEEGVFDN